MTNKKLFRVISLKLILNLLERKIFHKKLVKSLVHTVSGGQLVHQFRPHTKTWLGLGMKVANNFCDRKRLLVDIFAKFVSKILSLQF